MRWNSSLVFILLLFFALATLAEGQKLVVIKEVLEDPYKYKCSEIKVRGVVTKVLSDYVSDRGYVYKRFYIDDGTGEIKVFCSIGKKGMERRIDVREGMEVEIIGSSGVWNGEPEILGYYTRKMCPRFCAKKPTAKDGGWKLLSCRTGRSRSNCATGNNTRTKIPMDSSAGTKSTAISPEA